MTVKIYEEAAKLLQGKRLEEVTVRLTPPQFYRLCQLAEANHWEKAEGLEITLAYGHAWQEARKVWGSSGAASKERFEELATRYQTRYATLKFMDFRLLQNNQTLKFNRSGFRSAAAMSGTTSIYLTNEAHRLYDLNCQLRLRAGMESTPYPDYLEKPAPPTEAPSELRDKKWTHAKVYPDGSALYTLSVIEELARAVKEESSFLPGDGTSSLVEKGLAVLENQSGSENGEITPLLLEQLAPDGGGEVTLQKVGEDGPASLLKMLDRFISSLSSVLVMGGQVARYLHEGRQLEEEVAPMRESDERWQAWAGIMRAGIARLEEENRAIENSLLKPEAPIAPQKPGVWYRLKNWLLGNNRVTPEKNVR